MRNYKQVDTEEAEERDGACKYICGYICNIRSNIIFMECDIEWE